MNNKDLTSRILTDEDILQLVKNGKMPDSFKEYQVANEINSRKAKTEQQLRMRNTDRMRMHNQTLQLFPITMDNIEIPPGQDLNASPQNNDVKAVTQPDGTKIELYSDKQVQTTNPNSAVVPQQTPQAPNQIAVPQGGAGVQQDTLGELSGKLYNFFNPSNDVDRANTSAFFSMIARSFLPETAPATKALNVVDQRNQSVLYDALRKQVLGGNNSEGENGQNPKPLSGFSLAALPVEKQKAVYDEKLARDNQKSTNALREAQRLKLLYDMNQGQKIDTQYVTLKTDKRGRVVTALINRQTGDVIKSWTSAAPKMAGDGKGKKGNKFSDAKIIRSLMKDHFLPYADAVLQNRFPEMDRARRMLEFLSGKDDTIDPDKVFSLLPNHLKSLWQERQSKYMEMSPEEATKQLAQDFNDLIPIVNPSPEGFKQMEEQVKKGNFPLFIFTSKDDNDNTINTIYQFKGIDENGNIDAVRIK